MDRIFPSIPTGGNDRPRSRRIRNAIEGRELPSGQMPFRDIVFEGSSLAMVLVSLDGIIHQINRAFATLFGYAAADMVRRPLSVVLGNATQRSELNSLLSGALRSVEFETNCIRKSDGATVWANASVALLRDEEARPLCYLYQLSDVTEQRKAVADLARLQALHSSIVASSNDAIVGKSLDGTVISWNKAAERIFGYTADEMIGRNIAVLVPPGREDDIGMILGRVSRDRRFNTTRPNAAAATARSSIFR